MFFNTYVFQAGLVNLLFHKFKGTILLSAAYLALSISFHVWIMVGWAGHSCWVLPRDFSMIPQLPTVLSHGLSLEGVSWKMSHSMTLWLASGWDSPVQSQPQPSSFPKGNL